ncbi:MAG: M23 family metallopeptidase [Chitinispirillaceae bacterium]|nr:M23 family metallopeptidase [Chitinispirillaceae bacterium]
MRLLKYRFVVVNNRSNSRVRQFKCTGVAAVSLCLVLLASSVGLARLAWYGALHGYAQVVYLAERHEHESLVKKLFSLTDFLSKQAQKLNDLVVFEDVTRLAVGLDPISTDVRQAGIGGFPSAFEPVIYVPKDPLIRKVSSVQESLTLLIRRAQLQNATFEQVGEHVKNMSSYWAQRPSIWPTEGRVTSEFGYRIDPLLKIRVHHDGLDIANRPGTPVCAPADGVVKEAKRKHHFGKAVVLEHPETGLESIYAHLDGYAVTRGQWVKRGQCIGFMGNTGKSTGPHLHYEIRENRRPINPARFILPTDHIID